MVGRAIMIKAGRCICLLIGLAAAVILIAPPATRAQICPGSQLFYVVRDAKGAIIDAGRNELKFAGDGSPESYSHWAVEALNAQRLRSKEVPPEISQLDGKMTLKNQAMCNFSSDVRLQLTLGGKTMNLLFHLP